MHKLLICVVVLCLSFINLFFTALDTKFRGYIHVFTNVIIFLSLMSLPRFPTRIPDIPGQFPSLLDLFLTSVPEFCTPTRLPPLGSSDHCVISISIDMTVKSTSEPLIVTPKLTGIIFVHTLLMVPLNISSNSELPSQHH